MHTCHQFILGHFDNCCIIDMSQSAVPCFKGGSCLHDVCILHGVWVSQQFVETFSFMVSLHECVVVMHQMAVFGIEDNGIAFISKLPNGD